MYAAALPVFLLVAAAVPEVGSADKGSSASSAQSQREPVGGLVGYAALMFFSVLVATFFIVKASTLMTQVGYGTAADGSLAISAISLGSLVAGALYGRIRAGIGGWSLTAYYALGAAGFLLPALVDALPTMMVGAFLLGYALMAFVPFIQENVTRDFAGWGATATNVALVTQALGAFAAPYLGTVLDLATPELHAQFVVCAVLFALLAGVSVTMTRRG